MKKEDIRETSVWALYEKGRNYHSLTGIYTDTDRNYRFYNGNQWEGAKLGDIEPVQKNFIKPTVKYKVSVVHSNLYAICYSSMNFENREFRRSAAGYCKLLNTYASNIWERDKMDAKLRTVTKDAAINGEGIIYVTFDKDRMTPINEIVKKNDVYYGNENEPDLQLQPYILIRKRIPVNVAREFARNNGVKEEDIENIIGDNDIHENSGDAAKYELDNMVTLVLKLYKEDGTVRCSSATRYCELTNDEDTGLTLYPVAHFNWEEKEGSARGEGEVKTLIPNQIEVNRTEMRRVLTVKYQAYPQRVADVSKIINPEALDTVGATIKTEGLMVDDVRKIVGTLPPAQMSGDVRQLQDDLINITRELAGAGDSATGQINPETASGRAILVVQQASQLPITEQREACKSFVEDLGRIYLDYLTVHSFDGVNLEEEYTDPVTGDINTRIVRVPQIAIKELKASVRIDITPKSVFDKYAQEQTLENLLTAGFFTSQRVGELAVFATLLDDDSTAPKRKILDAVDKIKSEQRRIAELEAKAQRIQQNANRFLTQDADAQAQQIADSQRASVSSKAAAM